MTTLTVYGIKNGKESEIFINLADTPVAIAQQNRYEITRAYRSGTIQTGYRATDITAEFLRA